MGPILLGKEQVGKKGPLAPGFKKNKDTRLIQVRPEKDMEHWFSLDS